MSRLSLIFQLLHFPGTVVPRYNTPTLIIFWSNAMNHWTQNCLIQNQFNKLNPDLAWTCCFRDDIRRKCQMIVDYEMRFNLSYLETIRSKV